MQGFIRISGRPWAWNDPKSGNRRTAKGVLHKIFHNPFYAGWATSERFGVKVGEVRGNWTPIITPDQYERGKEILLTHGHQMTCPQCVGPHLSVVRSLE